MPNLSYLVEDIDVQVSMEELGTDSVIVAIKNSTIEKVIDYQSEPISGILAENYMNALYDNLVIKDTIILI